MKHILLLVLAVLFYNELTAQPYQLTTRWGEEIKANRRTTLNDIIGSDETGFYAIRTRASLFLDFTFTLEHYGNDLRPINSVELELITNGRQRMGEFTLFTNNQIYIFSSYSDPQTRINDLFVQQVDKKTLKLSEPVSVAKIDFHGRKRSNDGAFEFRQSRDKSKLLIYSKLPFEKNEPERFELLVLDSEMKAIWQKQITIPYKDQLFDLESMRVSNDGEVHLLGLVYKDKRTEIRKGAANYSFELLSYYDKGTREARTPLTLPGKFITDMQIGILDNKDIVCAGFYSETGTLTIKGTYFLKLDGTRAVVANSFKEFELDFVAQNLTEREARKVGRKAANDKDIELFQFRLDQLVVDNVGGVFLVGEQFYVKRRVTTTRNATTGAVTTQTDYLYYYNDIIAIRINASGEILWAQKIPKRQLTINDGGASSSYTFGVRNGQLLFIYNDSVENLNYTGKGPVARAELNSSRGVVMLCAVSGTGQVKRQPVFGAKEVNVIIRPRVCEQISPNEFVLFGQRAKKQQFAVLDIKD
ncbi:MAG: hypothetical protein KF775_10985 [Cyclobacteriaceae bacterium]|nr:hypothetical protein [Cyclobacteriaceae bacterium]